MRMYIHIIVPRHLILQKDTLCNISDVRTRSSTKKLNHCLENQKGINSKAVFN